MTSLFKLLPVLLLSACACKPQIEYRTAEIPEPPAIQRPVLDTDALNTGADAGVVLQAHRSTIIKLKAWGLELEKALDAYRKTK